MAVLFDPHYQAVDANGLPMSGAKLYFYLAGTSTPTTVYLDAAGSTPATNPIIADSAGLFAPAFVGESTAYKVILKTSGDVTVQTVDFINPANPATAAAASAAASAAAAAASAALSGPVGVYSGNFEGDGVETTFTLPVEPISAAHVLIVVDGVPQSPVADDDVVYTIDGLDIIFTEPPPAAEEGWPVKNIFYRIIAISDGEEVPPDGSVTKTKIAASAVGDTEIDGTEAPAIRTKLGVAIGTDVQAYDAQTALAGSVVDSAHTFYASNADISTVIPLDDTIPQVGEGTGILSLALTPKSITNKLRISFVGTGSASALANISASMFVNGGANAVRADSVTCGAANHSAKLAMKYEYVPGALTAQTITVRVGPASGTMRMNGTTAARYFGGTEASTLTIEEIKA